MNSMSISVTWKKYTRYSNKPYCVVCVSYLGRVYVFLLFPAKKCKDVGNEMREVSVSLHIKRLKILFGCESSPISPNVRSSVSQSVS